MEKKRDGFRRTRTKDKLSREPFAGGFDGVKVLEGKGDVSRIGRGILDAVNSSNPPSSLLPLSLDLWSVDPFAIPDSPTTAPPLHDKQRLPKPSLSSYRFAPSSLPAPPLTSPATTPSSSDTLDSSSNVPELSPPRSPRTTSLQFRPFASRRASEQSPSSTAASVNMSRDARSVSLSSTTLKSRFWSRNKSTPPPGSPSPDASHPSPPVDDTHPTSPAAEGSIPAQSNDPTDSPSSTKTIPRRPSLSEMALKVLYSFNRGKEGEDDPKCWTKGNPESIEILSVSNSGNRIVRDDTDGLMDDGDGLKGFMSPEMRTSSIAPQGSVLAQSKLYSPAISSQPSALPSSSPSSSQPPYSTALSPIPLSPSRKPFSSTTPRSLQPPPRPRKNSQRPKATPSPQNTHRRIISDAVWTSVSISASDVSSSSTRVPSGSSGASSRRRRVRKDSEGKGKEREVKTDSGNLATKEVLEDDGGTERSVSIYSLPDSPDLTDGDRLAGIKQSSTTIFSLLDETTPPPSPPLSPHVQRRI